MNLLAAREEKLPASKEACFRMMGIEHETKDVKTAEHLH